MISILDTMFAWPQGIVVGNLIASFIWAAPVFIHQHFRLRKLERKLSEVHSKITEEKK